VQRRTSVFIFFRTAHFRAAETTADAHLDAFRTSPHGGLHSTFDGTTVVDPRFNLLCDLLAYDVGIDFGFADLKDVDLDVFARQHLYFFFDQVHLFTPFADDDAGAAGVDGDGNPLEGAFDDNAADAVLHRFVALPWIVRRSFRAAGTQVLANPFVLYYLKTVVFIGKPV